jgi:hypothetical protein
LDAAYQNGDALEVSRVGRELHSFIIVTAGNRLLSETMMTLRSKIDVIFALCNERDPDRRYQTAAEFATALREAASATPRVRPALPATEPVQDIPPPLCGASVRPAPRRRRHFIAVLPHTISSRLTHAWPVA